MSMFIVILRYKLTQAYKQCRIFVLQKEKYWELWTLWFVPLGKNEVTLEFHQHDDAQICLMEMRFYIPATSDGTAEDPVKVM